MAVTAHHQQVCAKASALCDQYIGDIVFLADGAILDGVDAMTPEMLHGVVGLQRVRPGLMLTVHDKNANLARLVQLGQTARRRRR